MYKYLENMKKLLEADPDAKQFLLEIYEPVIVETPPEDARRGFRIMPDGEIRHYGFADRKTAKDPLVPVYIFSRDCGISWKKKLMEETDIGASVQSPYSGRWITANARTISIDDGNGLRRFEGLDRPINSSPQPFFLTHRNRCIIAGQYPEKNFNYPMVAYSDDEGETWKTVLIPLPPLYETEYPSVDTRWLNCGSEPNIVELPDRTLMMLIRNSLDRFSVTYSHDDGETWTPPEPSVFYGTATTPYLLRLSNGSILCTWCNTMPLPEVNHKLQLLPAPDCSCCHGIWEDVFTNRDVAHAAISENGYHWKGFREILLNPLRNAGDFRTVGGPSNLDKSVHQSQIIELPYNKVLVAVGQHPVLRKLLIFDLNWLLEKKRSEDFQYGLSNLSTFTYVKSMSASCAGLGITGHAAWNRTNGPLLVPDPSEPCREALQLCRIRDPRLFSEVQGAAWNFPASRHGKIELKLRVIGAGIRVSLLDHWMNPIDTSVRDTAPYSFEINRQVLTDAEQHLVRLEWDLDAGIAYLSDLSPQEAKRLFKIRMRVTVGEPNITGISYLHLHSVASEEDPHGTYLSAMQFQALDHDS